MNDERAHAEIGRLEERIEELRQSIERCGKIAVAAQIAIAGGAMWFVLALLTVLTFTAVGFVAAIAAVLGGFVLLGSNRTTRDEYQAALDAAEARRSELIDTMHLQLVESPTVTLH